MRNRAIEKSRTKKKNTSQLSEINKPSLSSNWVEKRILPMQKTIGNRAVHQLVEAGPTGSNSSTGRPLSKSTRAFFESRFGYDFSGVRIHTGAQAVMFNRILGAKAFTAGDEIYFRQEQPGFDNISDRRLLAHELTHVIQQGIEPSGAGLFIQRSNDHEIMETSIAPGYARNLSNQSLGQMIRMLEAFITLEEYETEDELEVARSNLSILQAEARRRNLDIDRLSITPSYARSLTDESLTEQFRRLDELLATGDYDSEDERSAIELNICILLEEAERRDLNLIPEVHVQFEPGELTRQREGLALIPNRPAAGVSGVTLGYGYDLGSQRNPGQRERELRQAGLTEEQIDSLRGAFGLQADDAQQWYDNNIGNLPQLTHEQCLRLLEIIWPDYIASARHRATHPTQAGRAFISRDRWDRLQPVIRELLVDLAFVGAHYAHGRRDQINAILADENLDTLEQLRRLRPAVENIHQGARGRRLRLSFIDNAIRQLEQDSYDFCYYSHPAS